MACGGSRLWVVTAHIFACVTGSWVSRRLVSATIVRCLLQSARRWRRRRSEARAGRARCVLRRGLRRARRRALAWPPPGSPPSCSRWSGSQASASCARFPRIAPAGMLAGPGGSARTHNPVGTFDCRTALSPECAGFLSPLPVMPTRIMANPLHGGAGRLSANPRPVARMRGRTIRGSRGYGHPQHWGGYE